MAGKEKRTRRTERGRGEDDVVAVLAAATQPVVGDIQSFQASPGRRQQSRQLADVTQAVVRRAQLPQLMQTAEWRQRRESIPGHVQHRQRTLPNNAHASQHTVL